MLNPGDAIIVTDQDHEANTGVWRRLADRGIEVREWHIDAEHGQLSIDDLAPLLDGPVKLVCFPHCSNIVGQENPVARIVAMAHAAGLSPASMVSAWPRMVCLMSLRLALISICFPATRPMAHIRA